MFQMFQSLLGTQAKMLPECQVETEMSETHIAEVYEIKI